jgi:spore coat protein U-like protein
MAFVHGRKCTIFINRSTTMRIASKALDYGRYVMKSNEIDFHGLSGISIGCNNPYGQC